MGESALKVFWESNLRLAVSVAREFTGRAPFDDLIQVASMALRPVVDRFDYTKGFKFSTYAFRRIRGEILKYFAETRRTMRLTVEFQADLQKVIATREELTNEGYTPSVELLARLTDFSVEKVREILIIERRLATISANQPIVNDKGSASELGDLLASDDPTPEENYIAHDIEPYLRVLNERSRRIVSLHLGLANGRTHTFHEIGVIFGLSYQRISQIYNKSLEKMRKALE